MTNLERVKRGKNQLPLEMSAMVQLIKPAAGCNELRVSPGAMAEQRSVCNAFKSAKNQTIVFAGGSRSGNMLAAEAIAVQSGKDLMRINLSAVVSKFIGETEKNLNRVFDSARKGDAILFFDEADALFGKRTEVKDSHDRYANVEVSYLIKRMESHHGLIIFAVQDTRSVDVELQRRVSNVIDLSGSGSGSE